MSCKEQLAEGVTLHLGDCCDLLSTLAENSIDSCVTDPPYHLTSIVKRFGKPESAPLQVSEFFQENGNSKGSSPYKRPSAGFMGKQWDGGDIAFRPDVWAEVFRVLKPGAHLLAFGGTRTYHRMVCAIEDAGFEIRDSVMWLYGSGFNKQGHLSYKLESSLCERRGNYNFYRGTNDKMRREPPFRHADADELWGLAGTLKPACEPIVLARKPLSEKTIAANVLKWGCGALNIGACRIEGGPTHGSGASQSDHAVTAFGDLGAKRVGVPNIINTQGRWPANVVHDGSAEVLAAFPETGISSGGKGEASQRTALAGHVYGEYSGATLGQNAGGLGDSGSAARFFYTAKADSDDRLGSKHPTVKPLDLMQYLVRLVTQPGGVVLDPFAGTGTTGEAAWCEKMRAVLIEREPEYQADIRQRMALALAGRIDRIKAAMRNKPVNHGPLFESD
jgi:DNA modification methylase